MFCYLLLIELIIIFNSFKLLLFLILSTIFHPIANPLIISILFFLIKLLFLQRNVLNSVLWIYNCISTLNNEAVDALGQKSHCLLLSSVIIQFLAIIKKFSSHKHTNGHFPSTHVLLSLYHSHIYHLFRADLKIPFLLFFVYF